MEDIMRIGRVYKRFKNTVWIEVKKAKFEKLLKELKSFDARISSISGYDNGNIIEIIYHFDVNGKLINVKLRVEKDVYVINSITKLFPGAELFERELMEMFGIEIKNHPDPRNLFLDERLSPKNPLRKKIGDNNVR